MEATVGTKIRDGSVYPALDAIADRMAHAERHLFLDRYVHGKSWGALKREYIVRFRMTARQFNSITSDLAGKVNASRDSMLRHLRNLDKRVGRLPRQIEELQARADHERSPDRKRKLRQKIHGKKRHLYNLQQERNWVAKRLLNPVPRLCFGGGKIFCRQFHLAANGYRSHDEWLQDWQATRSDQFLCLGSKDETGGNQTCTLLPGGMLRLRVPPGLEGQYGRWILIRDVHFPYGQDVIDYALKVNQAITFRFLRRKRKGKWVWYVHATAERPPITPITRRGQGAIGVDFNFDPIAATRIDRYGNPTASRHFPADLEGKTRHQREAILGEVVADIVAWAQSEGVPIVIEKLDFEKRKLRVRELPVELRRKLSSFACRKFHDLVVSRAARCGVEVIEVNPAYTTTIRFGKFAGGYNLSVHAAAAVAIARRGLGFGERLCSRLRPGSRNGSALPLPVRNRGRHVWSDWGRYSRRLRAAARAAGRGRCSRKGGRMRGIPLSTTAPAPQKGREGPSRDGSPSGPGG